MFLVTGGKGRVCAFFFLQRHNHKHIYTHTGHPINWWHRKRDCMRPGFFLVKD
jgi:hypothetical protein